MPLAPESATTASASAAGVARAHTPWRDDLPTRPAYLHDTSQVESQLRLLAHMHPGLARVVTIGNGELAAHGLPGGHQLQALVLGAHPDDPSVPRIVHVAGIHPRELANPELLLRWAQRTLELAAQGAPAQQALLAARTIALVPIANPEGRDIVVRGLEVGDADAIWHRTNANPDGPVDLNRNFDAFWGAGGHPTPGQAKYAGEAPASESEVAALQSFVMGFAPAALYDWHSPGGVVLTPWGHTPEPPAAAPRLQRAAQAVARVMGYACSSSFGEWETKATGTLKDWAHLRTGVTSMTIETGAYHHQDDAQFADTLARAMPALDMLAATVDGSRPAPAGAELLASPPAASMFVMPPASAKPA